MSLSSWATQNTAATTAISKSRAGVLHDAGRNFPMVSVDQFYEHWLPKVPDLPGATVQDIVAKVKRSRAYVRRRWAAFTRDPEHASEEEEDVFHALVPVIRGIEKVASTLAPHLVPTTKFVTAPTEPPRSTERLNRSRPDAYFVFKDPHRYSATKRALWLDIAITGEFKKKNTRESAFDDIKKALWNVHHSNREDARRRFLFAFTIENRSMRLWYADHSTIAVSAAFDFMGEPEYFIRFVLAFLYAPHENFGFDTTITTDWDGKKRTKPQYLITVQSRLNPRVVKKYKTIKLLSGIGAEAIRGRGTRVWQVREWKGNKMTGKLVVLKDCWIDSDREVEGEIMQNIVDSATTAKEKAALEKMFLTILIDGKVKLTDGTFDQTVSGDVRELLINDNPSIFTIVNVAYGDSRSPTPKPRNSNGARSGDAQAAGDHRDPGVTTEIAPLTVACSPKDRYRIVFKEVCQALHQVKSLFTVLFMLMQASAALRVLHGLGWVHRDISAGNILLSGKTVKIADLEYAKKVDEPTSASGRNIRTGTADFMAIEVASNSYMFVPRKIRPVGRVREIEDIDEKVESAELDLSYFEPKFRAPPEPISEDPWFYNPLHDNESVLWLLFLSLFTNDIVLEPRASSSPPSRSRSSREIVETDEKRNKRIVDYMNLSHSLFVDHSGRVSIMLGEWLPNWLQAHPLHPAIATFASSVEEMWQTLVDTYRKVEENPQTIDHTCADGVHRIFTSQIWTCIQDLRGLPYDVTLRPLSAEAKKLPKDHRDKLYAILGSPTPSAGTKRTRDSDDGDTPPAKSPRRGISDSPSSATSLVLIAPPARHRKAPAARQPPTAAASTTQAAPRARATQHSQLAVAENLVAAPANGRVLRSRTRNEATAKRAEAPVVQAEPPPAPAAGRARRAPVAARPSAKTSGDDKTTKVGPKTKAKTGKRR